MLNLSDLGFRRKTIVYFDKQHPVRALHIGMMQVPGASTRRSRGTDVIHLDRRQNLFDAGVGAMGFARVATTRSHHRGRRRGVRG
jgi:hypothetical protein